MADKRVLFLSSSFVNLSRIFSEKNPNITTLLILDRKFPFDADDRENLLVSTFPYEKLFDKSPKQYFDNLAVFVSSLEPDVIILNNFSKEINKEFIDFMKFRNPKIQIILIKHADGKENSEIRELLDDEELKSYVIDMISGKELVEIHPTTIKQLKEASLIHDKEEIISLRIKNVVLSYHERTKILKGLSNIITNERA